MNGFVNGLCRPSRCPSRSAERMECRVPTGRPLPAPDPRCPPGGRRRDSRPRGAGGLRRGQQEREHGPGEECEHVARSEPAAQEELLTVQPEQRPPGRRDGPSACPPAARGPRRGTRDARLQGMSAPHLWAFPSSSTCRLQLTLCRPLCPAPEEPRQPMCNRTQMHTLTHVETHAHTTCTRTTRVWGGQRARARQVRTQLTLNFR